MEENPNNTYVVGHLYEVDSMKITCKRETVCYGNKPICNGKKLGNGRCGWFGNCSAKNKTMVHKHSNDCPLCLVEERE